MMAFGIRANEPSSQLIPCFIDCCVAPRVLQKEKTPWRRQSRSRAIEAFARKDTDTTARDGLHRGVRERRQASFSPSKRNMVQALVRFRKIERPSHLKEKRNGVSLDAEQNANETAQPTAHHIFPSNTSFELYILALSLYSFPLFISMCVYASAL